MSLASLVRGYTKTVGGAFRKGSKAVTNAGSKVFRPVKTVATTASDTLTSVIKSVGTAAKNLAGGGERLVSGVAQGAGRTGTLLKYALPVGGVVALGGLLFVGYQYLMAPKRAAFG